MKIIPILAMQDNYMYLIIDDLSNKAAIVDPVDPDRVLNVVKKENVDLTCILTTHHHFDHAGGNKKMVSKAPHLDVYGGDKRIHGVTSENEVTHHTEIQLGSLTIKCLYTPCHTTGHVCYFVEDGDEIPSVFTGDTLFLAGCGRFFEGNAEDMYNSLINILGKLPPSTKVYCGHEYSLANLKFALHVEPENKATNDKIKWAEVQISKGLTTVPSTIEEEFSYNPFMRVDNANLQQRCGTASGVETMKYLRDEKDAFSPLTFGTVVRFAYWYIRSHYQNMW